MFKIGKEIRRSEIHRAFSGQAQGGVSTPADHPMLFIFTSTSGEQFGYKDEFKPDGIFHYTGEGQEGDMQMSRGNAAILNHRQDGKDVFLFESTQKRSHVRCIGTAECIGYHEETRPDKEGKNRKAFIFHLDVNSADISIYAGSSVPNETEETRYLITLNGEIGLGKEIEKQLKRKNLQELREIASLPGTIRDDPDTRRVKTYRRSEALKKYILLRSDGLCEGCNQAAPFKSKNGPYLECHHVNRRADGGPDIPSNVIAVCPNCHREAHYSVAAELFNNRLKSIASRKENPD